MAEKFVLDNFHSGVECRAYDFFGCHLRADGGYVFRVWAPHAESVWLALYSDGEKLTPMRRLSDGESFETAAPAERGTLYRYLIATADGRRLYKADPYAFYCDRTDPSYSVAYSLPGGETVPLQRSGGAVNIFEVNLLSWRRHGDNSYYTFAELEKTLVPYVAEMGYTYVEFMPVTEFPYDGSWGYQVTGYFAPTARMGTPEEFRSLVETFHKRGIGVIIDWVPAHFPKDEWGLYEFDGQPLYECPLWDRMEHLGWGTRKFDFGRGEVDSFLLSSACYFIEKFGVDGLRVDAVASMLYLDYDRQRYDCTLNRYGDNRNLEAIEFLKKFNDSIRARFPEVLTIAEESTAFDGVTRETAGGGLGFDYKWNMGWMNDVLFYCRQDPYFRAYHHNKITFSLMYAFSEKFILPLSHDEVVHVKGSIVNKMFGSYEDKFAGERSLLGFMFAHPGKKLNFMGYEIAQFSEWNYSSAIEYGLTKYELHRKMRHFVKKLNGLYLATPALSEIDDGWEGFEWLVVDDNISNLLAFKRSALNGDSLICVINFSGVDLHGYGIGADKGSYRVVLNTDDRSYGGGGRIKKRVYKTVKQTSQGREHSIFVDIPRLTCMYITKQK